VARHLDRHECGEITPQRGADSRCDSLGDRLATGSRTDLQIRHAYTHPSRITPVGSTESVPCGIDRHDYTGTVQQCDLDRSFLRLMLPYLPQLIAMPFVPWGGRPHSIDPTCHRITKRSQPPKLLTAPGDLSYAR
jgi:hypothetical protein